MNSNIDVLKELKEKNKEIYINKLCVDLDINLENLKITIKNMISLLTTELKDKIEEISGSKSHDKIEAFQKSVYNKLIELIEKRALTLKEKVQNIDNIDYQECLDSETIMIIEEIKTFYKDHIGGLIDELSNNLDDYKKKRLQDYLTVLFYDRLIDKIKANIVIMNNILCNNYRDSYQKFLNLNEKTLK